MPPLTLMAVIFYLSAQEDLSSGLGDWDLILRKGAHMTEFGLLALLWWRALRSSGDRGHVARDRDRLTPSRHDEC